MGDGGIGDSTLPYKPSLAWKFLEKAFSPSKDDKSYRPFYSCFTVRQEFMAEDPVHGPVLKNVDMAQGVTYNGALVSVIAGSHGVVYAFKKMPWWPGNQRQRYVVSAWFMLALIPEYMFGLYIGGKYGQHKYPVDRLDAETERLSSRSGSRKSGWSRREWLMKRRHKRGWLCSESGSSTRRREGIKKNKEVFAVYGES